METLETKIKQNSANKFYCKFCDYGTSRKSNYDAHLNSRRHSQGNQMETNSANLLKIKQNNNEKKYRCGNCEKDFSNRSGLWKHKKICNVENKIISKNEITKNEIIKNENLNP
jgi:hypothetical protein